MKTNLSEEAVQKMESLSLIAVKTFVVLTVALSMFMVGQQFMAAQHQLDAEPNQKEHATDIGEPKHCDRIRPNRESQIQFIPVEHQ